MDPLFLMRILKAGIVILAVVIVGGIVIWAQNDNAESKAESKAESRAELNDRYLTTDRHMSEFDRLLATGSLRQLVDLFASLSAEEKDAIPTRLRKIEKRIAVSDRILELDADRTTHNMAVKYKLQMLIERELFALEHGFSNRNQISALKEYSLENRRSDDPQNARLALTGETLAGISEFLNKDHGEKRRHLANNALELFSSNASRSDDIKIPAEQMFEFVQVIRTRGEEEEINAFGRSFSDAYANTADPAIAALVENVRSEQASGQFNFKNILRAVSSQRSQAVDELMDQIETVLSKNDVSGTSIDCVLQRGTDLLRLSRNKEARQVLEMIREQDLQNHSQALIAKVELFEKRLRLFDESFDVSPFRDSENRPTEFEMENANYKLIYFGSDRNYEKTITQFKEIMPMLEPRVEDSSLEVVVIYLDRDKNANALKSMKQFAGISTNWQVWFLETNTDEGKRFMNRVPINETPYLLILPENFINHA